MLHKGGHKAAAGTYWDIRTGQRVNMEQAGMLPGTEQTSYIKASGLMVLLAGPILGLLFAIFLPAIGIVAAAVYGAKKVSQAAAQSASFSWRPVEAYLAGKKHRKAGRQAKRHGR